ncbi:hypothetical protein [Nocardia asteroides]|uniref:hypothetical protein n=1 Tax=Nocardia asteroides TaxID=1824 RepID=UPI003433A300
MVVIESVASAQLAGRSTNDDRLISAGRGVVVLDGASSHVRDEQISGGVYAELLGTAIVRRLEERQPVASLLAESIAEVAETLELGSLSASPSSTVAIVRADPRGRAAAELLVLGDSMIIVGYSDGRQQVMCDERLGALKLPESDRYRSRLRAGTGFDQTHKALLADLQRGERRARNREGGYWIASEDPSAAHHALTAVVPLAEVEWVLLASDGVAEPVGELGPAWSDIAQFDSSELAALLKRLNAWEAEADPDGRLMPRSKRHDDKTIAVVRFSIDGVG